MKIFIVAPYFPPSPLPPSQRIRLMMPYLNELGVEATIFTTYEQFREEVPDPWMLELVGSGFNTVMVKSLPQGLTRKFGIGDLGLRMMPYLFFKLLKEIRRQKPDFILFPVPPWNLLIMVPLLHRLTRIKYGIDYIDPWIEKDKHISFKKRFSQWVAIALEKSIVKKASVIFAVSEGINEQLRGDYPFLAKERMVGVPYGGEKRDFEYFVANGNKAHTYKQIRYIGGVGPDMHEVARAVLLAIKDISGKRKIKAEFIGTTYATAKLAKPALTDLMNEYKLHDIASEHPERVEYKKAIALSMEADLILLFGGMKTYYAASKLMGILLSGKPMVAFVHRESFPSRFLEKVNFRWLVTYTDEKGDLPVDHVEELSEVMESLLNDPISFEKVDVEKTELKNYTAKAMTMVFIENIKKYVQAS